MTSMRPLLAFVALAFVALAFVATPVVLAPPPPVEPGPRIAQPVRIPVERRIDRAFARDRLGLVGSRVKVPVVRDPSGPAVREVLALRPGGLEIDAAAFDAARSELTLERGTAYVVRGLPETTGPVRLTDGAMLLPDRIAYAPTDQESTGNEPEVRFFAVFLALERDPVPWRGESFATGLIAGLVEVTEDDAPRSGVPDLPALPAPVTLRFTSSNVDLEPRAVKIRQFGVAGHQTIALTAARTASAYAVRALSDLGEQELTFDVEDAPVTVTVVGPKRMLGWGIESTTVRVERAYEDDSSATTGPLSLSISSSDNGLSASVVTIADGASASESVDYRPQGIGTRTITVTGGGVAQVNPLVIAVVLPWGILLLAMLGGAAGGAVGWWQERALRAKRREGEATREEREDPSMAARIGVGVVCGLALELAIAVGLIAVAGLVAFARTEVGALLFGIVGGYAGTAVLDLIMTALGLGKKEKPE